MADNKIYVHRDPIARQFYDVWKFCGCGNPEHIVAYVKGILKAYKDAQEYTSKVSLTSAPDDKWSRLRKNIDDAIATGKENDNARLFVLYWLDSQNYTEHGGSVYGAWITDNGRKLLALLEADSKDDWDEDPEVVPVDEMPALETVLP